MATILITGIAGSLAQLMAHRLIDEGHEIIGVDYRPKRPEIRREIRFIRPITTSA